MDWDINFQSSFPKRKVRSHKSDSHSKCDHDHSDGHGHGHGHSHGHHHHHHSGDGIKTAFFLNLSFTILEIVGGLWTNSVAILSDAIHDLGDTLAIWSAWYLEKKSQQKSDQQFSYGYRRFSVLAALLTGLILLGGSLLILTEAVPRLMNPVLPKANEMIILAIIGVVVNGAAAFRVSSGDSLNAKMIRLHLIEDVAGWVIVLMGAIAIRIWELAILDPILSIGLSLWVLKNAFINLKQVLLVLLQRVPVSITIQSAEDLIRKASGVLDVHHTHLWSIDGQKHILTAHIVVQDQLSLEATQKIKSEVKKLLKQVDILEATLEIENQSANCEEPEHLS